MSGNDDFNPEDELVTQMGLLLTQMRYARRALEDIERNTSHFVSIGLMGALTQGNAFGEPPLLNGALKVHIVNINDLTASSGSGLLEGILGGIGRFFGGFLGGFAGGTIGGFFTTIIFGRISSAVEAIDRILDRLGFNLTKSELPSDKSEKPKTCTEATQKAVETSATATSPAKSGIAKSIDNLEIMKAITGLLKAASTGPESAKEEASSLQSEEGKTWLGTLAIVSDILQSISHIVDGLILLIPVVMGALASVIVRIDSIKLAVAGLLQFAIQNVLLLRGVLLVTIYDTIAAIAGLAAKIVSIFGSLINSVLTSVFTIIPKILDAAIAGLKLAAKVIVNTIPPLLTWMVKVVGSLLDFLGTSPVFRLVEHVVKILPALLPPLILLIRDKEIGSDDRKALASASTNATFTATSSCTTSSGATLKFPNLDELIFPKTETNATSQAFSEASDTIIKETRTAFTAVESALTKTADTMREATNDSTFGSQLADHISSLSAHAKDISEALKPVSEASGVLPSTGLEAIADAYQNWAVGGGLQAMLSTVTDHIERTPSIPKRIVEAVAPGETAAIVEIDKVVIEVLPTSPSAVQAAPTAQTVVAEFSHKELLKKNDEFFLRGGRRQFDFGSVYSSFS